MNIEKINNLLKKKIPESNIFFNEYMRKHTSFQVGGVADVFVKVQSIPEVEHVYKVAKKKKIDLKIMGNGTNIIVNDKGVRSIVLKIELDKCEILKTKDIPYVIVQAGMPNPKLAQILLKEGISGFEFASGIPGTIGGAIKMNAGAFGGEFKDIVEETIYLDMMDGNIKTISNKEHNFSYRNSIFFQKNTIILSSKLKLSYGKKDEINKKMKENLEQRQIKQPLNYPSAGSTWKRGKDFISAQIIDECELKGKAIGGAQVSTKHAGFIINTGDADAKDVLELIDFVQKKVFEKTGKKLETEVEIW